MSEFTFCLVVGGNGRNRTTRIFQTQIVKKFFYFRLTFNTGIKLQYEQIPIRLLPVIAGCLCVEFGIKINVTVLLIDLILIEPSLCSSINLS